MSKGQVVYSFLRGRVMAIDRRAPISRSVVFDNTPLPTKDLEISKVNVSLCSLHNFLHSCMHVNGILYLCAFALFLQEDGGRGEGVTGGFFVTSEME